ncbi:DUF3995 domain-containing protein [Tenacibaculum jejuense]|uniref:DUF3995 domain-containing protein n=1 Tax=Tenacibaculum jejuense TaxID=584609 RepID=A0A238UAJ8_9FLAO|nr:DUF3995 domain-containing protein [Tenacibaculum jejuense]SNR15598.1 conserved membrane protein of unknown function [Tenacibaculum jejuense]
MTFFIAIICSIILLIISLFHFYWAFGGTFGLDRVIPTNTKQVKVLKAPPILTLLVAFFVLLIFSSYIQVAKIYDFYFLPQWIKTNGLLIFSSIFLLRAIGDFKYVGFFKRIKQTKFAVNDTKFFSPLCLFLALSGYLLLFLN